MAPRNSSSSASADAGPRAVPFNRASVQGRELEYVAQAIADGHISGDGGFTRRCETLLERELGAPRVLLTTSGTHALEMLALLLDVRAGDEIIMPSFTFVSTANAFALRGARPVFADIRPDTLNLDERRVASLATPRTRAIVAVHYAGVACEMEAVLAAGAQWRIPVVEDNAHGLFGKYRGQMLGTFGPVAALSFHETKNLTCGEGGALVLNDASLIDRAEIVRQKGTDRQRFLRGLVDKYTWTDLGSSYAPADLLAAFLYGQLESWRSVQDKRRRVWDRYAGSLRAWASANGVSLPVVPGDCEQAYHMFYLLMPTPGARDRLIAHLRRAGILAVFHYVPLHLSPVGRRCGGFDGQCPVTEDVSARLVRLPFYNDLSEPDQQAVVDAIFLFDEF